MSKEALLLGWGTVVGGVLLVACAPKLSPQAANLQVVTEGEVDSCASLGEFSDYSAVGGLVDPNAGRRRAGLKAKEKAAQAGATHIVAIDDTTTGYGGYAKFRGYDCNRRVAASAAPVASPESARSPAPEQVAGFAFGLGGDAARALCEGAGHAWQPGAGVAVCTGSPVASKLPTEVQLRFCESSLCDITVLSTLPAAGPGEQELTDQLESLQQSYGKPEVFLQRPEEGCVEPFFSCLESGKGLWQAAWNWPDGGQIIAKAIPKDGAVRLAKRYRFGKR